MLVVEHIETFAFSVQVGDFVGASVRWSETVRQSKVSGTGCVLKAGVYNPYTMSRNIIVVGDATLLPDTMPRLCWQDWCA